MVLIWSKTFFLLKSRNIVYFHLSQIRAIYSMLLKFILIQVFRRTFKLREVRSKLEKEILEYSFSLKVDFCLYKIFPYRLIYYQLKSSKDYIYQWSILPNQKIETRCKLLQQQYDIYLCFDISNIHSLDICCPTSSC